MNVQGERAPAQASASPDVRSRFVPAAVVAASVLVPVTIILTTGLFGRTVSSWVSNLGLVAVSMWAAISCGRAARRASGPQRWGWALIAIGVGGWGFGNAVWSWYELARGVEVPFPSLADVGYLMFPVGGITGLVVFARGAGIPLGVQQVIDGTLLLAALILVSWFRVFGAVVDTYEGAFTTSIALAYPVTDVLMITMVALLVRRYPLEWRALAILGAGFAAFAAADSEFAWEVAAGTYATGSVVDVGWFLGVTLIGLAPFALVAPAGPPHRPLLETRGPGILPAAFLGAALAYHSLADALGYRARGGVELWASMIVLAVVGRQLLLIRRNVGLAGEVVVNEERLRHQALHDALTGLPNRRALDERLSAAVASGDGGTLAFVDLDRFKDANDAYGHDIGDQILRAAAERLASSIREQDFLARIGGDEFAILWPANHVSGAVLARRVVDAFVAPLVVGGMRVSTSASVGFVPLSASVDARELLRFADLAMYAAKGAGGGRATPFDLEMSVSLIRRTLIETEILGGLQRGEFMLYFQPFADLGSGDVAGFEALIRWRHISRGMLQPSEFVPIAERAGSIHMLGTWILHEACEQAMAWQRARPDARPLPVSVNVSARQLEDDRFEQVVRGALMRSGLEPGLLRLEITETAIMTAPERAAQILTSLRRLGVQLSIDDFGTGYASLQYLSRLPVTEIKIDRSFIDGLGEDVEDTTIVAAVIGLAHSLRLEVVAEGVETEQQFNLLRDMGCHRAQGYLMSKPVPAADVVALHERRWVPSDVRAAEPVFAPVPATPGFSAQGPPHVPPALAEEGGDGRSPTRYRVILADDDADDRMLVRMQLEAEGSFDVVAEAADGETAIDLIAARQPHLVVLDLAMPRLDGLAALPRILMAAPGTKVVFLSGYVTPHAVDRAMSLGAVAFYKKGTQHLAGELRRALGRT